MVGITVLLLSENEKVKNMEFILGLIMEHMKWVLSGIGVPIITYIFFKKYSAQNIIVKIEQNGNDSIVNDTRNNFGKTNDAVCVSGASYQMKVGKKHKWLRESVLKLTLRQMTRFYGLDEVSKLESYENGEVELPIGMIEKLECFFFINSDVIDGDKPYIFKSFHLSQPSIHDLFEQGFLPKIACCPYDRGDLLCFVVMYKEEDGFTRIISSDLVGSFKSSGGGRMNIQYLIEELIAKNIPDYEVSVLTATTEDWKRLQTNCYYDTDLFHRLGAVDQECMNIFSQWYDETLKVRNLNNHKMWWLIFDITALMNGFTQLDW